MGKLLEVKNLSTTFTTKFGQVKAVNNVSFSLDEGEVLAIVGESGSGKSVTSMSIMRLLAQNGRVANGEILFEGKDLLKLKEKEMAKLRGKDLSMIFQDPMTCLNPVFTIGNQMDEVLKLHDKSMNKEQRHARCLEMLNKVGLSNPEDRLKQYPHELSGGMRQRIMIAMSLLCNPKLLIADEPTGNLDPTNSWEIMKLLEEANERGTTVLVVTHNQEIVNEMKKRVITMKKGVIVSDERKGGYRNEN